MRIKLSNHLIECGFSIGSVVQGKSNKIDKIYLNPMPTLASAHAVPRSLCWSNLIDISDLISPD